MLVIYTDNWKPGTAMRRLIALVIASVLFVSSSAFARDTVESYSIEDALGLEKAKSVLGDQVKFYFGNAFKGEVQKDFGEFRTNKKTNAFGKSDLAACQWAFLSAMVSLRDRALKEGGNAVVNIRSNYKNNMTTSETTFRCGAGGLMAGVALIGEVVTIEE